MCFFGHLSLSSLVPAPLPGADETLGEAAQQLRHCSAPGWCAGVHLPCHGECGVRGPADPQLYKLRSSRGQPRGLQQPVCGPAALAFHARQGCPSSGVYSSSSGGAPQLECSQLHPPSMQVLPGETGSLPEKDIISE
ncbi:uncharacterized protein LOC136716090 isoform X1 [Amia ocellicauda]|uniref:uncharacterized protein LOC136716090 isoform X1 n=1 Tax=Amia ocellicauda TaxID=2972642 RepID=UPI0034646D0A